MEKDALRKKPIWISLMAVTNLSAPSEIIPNNNKNLIIINKQEWTITQRATGLTWLKREKKMSQHFMNVRALVRARFRFHVEFRAIWHIFLS